MPRPTPRLAPVTTATRPRRSGAVQVIAAALPVQRGLLLRRRERPRGLRAALLAEREPQVARRAQAVGMVGAEGRARLVEIERAEQVALEVAVLARHLLRGSPNRRHRPTPASSPTPSLAERRHPTTLADGAQRAIPQMPQFFVGSLKSAANRGSFPGE